MGGDGGFYYSGSSPHKHIANLGADSKCRETEKGNAASRGQRSYFDYHNSTTRQSRRCIERILPTSQSQNFPARKYRPYDLYNSSTSFDPCGQYYESGYYSNRQNSRCVLAIVQHLKLNRKYLPLFAEWDTVQQSMCQLWSICKCDSCQFCTRGRLDN